VSSRKLLNELKVTREIKLFQNYFRSLLQLVNVFQPAQCR